MPTNIDPTPGKGIVFADTMVEVQEVINSLQQQLTDVAKELERLAQQLQNASESGKK